MRVATIVGTRPELIKLSRVIPKLDTFFEHTLIHTGQNYDYELNQIFFDDLGIRKPDYFLEASGDNAAQTIANVIEKSDEVLRLVKPDALLIYGDTNSCLSVISAKKLQIPIFHLEAGNRCFDLRVPEEINRKIVDHLSDINMVHSEHARRYLISEGLKSEQIMRTGSPMFEILDFYKDKINDSNILSKLKLSSQHFFLVSIHREENVDYPENFSELINSLNGIAKKYDMPVIVSTHPRTKKKLEAADFELDDRLRFLKPLGFFDYNKLQQESLCVLSDSGTITEEASLLNLTAIMIRQAHERPEGMDIGALVMAGLSEQRVNESINMALETKVKGHIDHYQNEDFSSQVVKIIQSYTDYINRVSWRKHV